jgi:hypothetical protein
MAESFLAPLTLRQTLDILISILLWVEEIHKMGFAINDLKNGNIMLNRRGQLKGIDLDAYFFLNKTKKEDDFMLLAILLVIFITQVFSEQFLPLHTSDLLKNEVTTMKIILKNAWPFDDLPKNNSEALEEVIDSLAWLISNCKSKVYSQDKNKFSHDIDKFIFLKRKLFEKEIVLA